MTTSASGLFGNFGQSNYGAAKMGLIGMMNVLKIEGFKYNIKVNAIAPNAGSRLTEGVMPPEQFEKMKPDFITPLVIYLCSEMCQENGNIYNAGQGLFNRTQVLNGATVLVGDGLIPPSAEEVWKSMDLINDMTRSEFYDNLPDFLVKFTSSGN